MTIRPQLLRELRPWLLLCIVLGGFSLNPDFTRSFWSTDYLPTLLQQAATNVVLATGLTFVILTGGIDLSVGAVMAFSGVALALSVTQGPPPLVAAFSMLPLAALAGWCAWKWIGGRSARAGIWAAVAAALSAEALLMLMLLSGSAGGIRLEGAIVIALLAGCGCGVLNGLAVTAGGAPPFIATLGMLTAARGLTLYVTGGASVGGLPPRLALLGEGWPLVAFAALIVAAGALLHARTRAGRFFTAIGSSEEASRLSGVDTAFYKTMAYVIAGGAAAAAALLLTAKFRLADTGAGMGAELNAIAAVVLGGASLSGGRASVIGSLAGALTIAVLNSGLVLVGVHDTLQGVIIGAVIVVVVVAERLANRLRWPARGKKAHV